MNPKQLGDGRPRLGCLGSILGAALIAVVGFASGAAAQSLTTLYSFTGGSDGAIPQAGLIADAAGNLYGTTEFGGQYTCYDDIPGCGTVFQLTPSGTLTVLYAFTGGSDGSISQGGLIADAAGNLYGTTARGGANALCNIDIPGCGTVFQLTPSGILTVLHAFTGYDGFVPQAGLITDAAGNLYGTTFFGGSFGCSYSIYDCGTVFQLTPSGTLSVLHTFYGGDGAFPSASLIADAAGNLYGTTSYGGQYTCTGLGCGTVFQLTPSGTLTVLHAFTGATDGAFPFAGLLADAAGNLYGTTVNGGDTSCNSPYGCGTVFQLTMSGILTVLHSFVGSDGASPYAGLIADAAGNLYGTTSGGGTSGSGTVFQLTPSGTLTVLHSFIGSDGANPQAGLIADAAGNLYGTTSGGGTSGSGTVFQLGGTSFALFAGVPGQANCITQSILSLTRSYGGTVDAAAARGFASVTDLEKAVVAYCSG